MTHKKTKKVRKRKKGGGRKFTDGRLSKRRFKNLLEKEFIHQHSIRDFVIRAGISRQSYYRFLNNNPKIKNKITEQRFNFISQEKKQREELLVFLDKNPDETVTDFYLKDLELPSVEIEINNTSVEL